MYRYQMFRFKPGVKICHIRPEMAMATLVVASVYEEYGYNCEFTSGLDGQHSSKSKHYLGHGGDFAISHIAIEDIEKIRDEIIEALTDEFDVVLESTHIHVEFDPVFN